MSILIVGGGMTGATPGVSYLALNPRRAPGASGRGRAAGLVAASGLDARAIALAAGTCQQLARTGIWQGIADCATPIQRVHVSDRACGIRDARCAGLRTGGAGQVVELHDVGQRLFAQLREAPGITLHCPAKVEDVTRWEEGVSITRTAARRSPANCWLPPMVRARRWALAAA